jgi:hypothetical protein
MNNNQENKSKMNKDWLYVAMSDIIIFVFLSSMCEINVLKVRPLNGNKQYDKQY